jgi:hypothetical protein
MVTESWCFSVAFLKVLQPKMLIWEKKFGGGGD